MADRYQDRSYGTRSQARANFESEESDPLAELARLIGQTDPFGTSGKQAGPLPPRSQPRQTRDQEYRQDYSRGSQHQGSQQESRQDHPQQYRQDPPQQQDYAHQYQPEYQQDDQQDYAAKPEEAPAPPSPPSWIQRANIRRQVPASREIPVHARAQAPAHAPQALPQEPQGYGADYVNPVHPLHRHAQPQQSAADTYYEDEGAYQPDQAYAQPQEAAEPSRYDEALYGQLEAGLQDLQREPAYPEDPYAYQAGYAEEADEPVQRRRSPMLAVIAVLLLGVVGTGAAYAYRTYFSGGHRGPPPIITADNSPTRIVPAQSDASAKVPDRMVAGNGTEKLVPREEEPVDVNARAAGPRVVFPPLNQNANPPSVASVSTSAMPPPPTAGAAPAVPSNGTLANGEPRKIKTYPIHGDQPDAAAVPVNTAQAAPTAAPLAAGAKPARGASRTPLTTANASANAPLSLAPQAGAPTETRAETHVASTAPTQIAPPATSSGAYMVQISSQRNEADAQASFRALQNKFPSVLASHTPVIRRADLGGKGVYYRAMVGPFGTSEEAVQFCGNLKSAGGQCIVQRN